MSNIAVYAKGTTDFFNQGIGVLSDVISSDTTQTVSSSGNVQSELELSYPVGGYLYEQLIEGNFLRVSMAVDSSKYAVFEIIDSIKDDSGTLTIYGAPYSDRIGRMSFDNGGKFGSYSSVQAALNFAKSQMKDFPSWFQLTSNISKAVDFTNDGIIKDFATFLDLLNQKVSGNVYYGLNIIQIYSALGKDRTDIILRDDRNTNSVKVKTDYSSIINRVIPVLPVLDKDGNATQETKVGTIVNSKTPNQFLDYWAGLAVQLDTQDLANTYFDRTHADRPVQTVDVDPIGIDEDLSDIDIFDRVQLYSTKLKYTDKLRVSKRVVDNLTGMVTSFSLGSSSVTLNNTIQQVQNDVANQIQAITSVVISASGKNQIYTSNVKPTSANEGDMWIQEDGDYQAFWVFKNGDWVKLVDSDTQKAITDGVTSAIEQAKIDAQGIVDSNNSVIRAEMQTVATQKAQDEIAKGNFDANAQAYANSAKSAAISQAQSLVSAQAQQAAKDLSDARLSIQNDINITNGNVKSLTDRADGWDATVVKVDNLAVGTRNYFALSNSVLGYVYTDGSVHGTSTANSDMMSDFIPVNPEETWQLTGWPAPSMGGNVVKAFYDSNKTYIEGTRIVFSFGAGTISKTVSLSVPSNAAYIRVSSQHMGNNQGAKAKLERATTPSDWTPAPEDLSAASAQAQLTADKAALDLKNYQVSNDGSVQKAQSDITVIAGKVETKVSKVDYDANNKTLNQNISTATQTATQAQTTINNYKTTTDGKLQTMSGQIDTVAGSVALAATKTELNTAKSEFSSQVSSVKADYNSVTQSVTELTGKFNDLGQSNLLLNTEWTPDASSWFGWSNIGANGLDQCVSIVTGQYKGSNGLLYDTTSQTSKYYARTQQDIPVNGQQVLSMSWVSKLISIASGMYCNIWINFLGADRQPVADAVFANMGRESNGYDWVYGKIENVKIPDGTVIVKPSFESREGVKIILTQPMFTFSDHVGSYSQGNYSNNDKIALQQITINSISDIVSSPTTGLSTRVQTAEGFLNQVRGTDIPALQKATFWQPYSSLDFNDYTEQGSFFFNTTSAKTNGPTTNNNYIYLVVEQGLPTSSSKGGRIKQTAWYDGVTGVKISYVRTLNNTTWSPWYANDNDSVATISVMNGQIEQEVSDRKSGDSNTLSQAKSYTESQISSASSGLNTTITQTANGIMAMTSTTNLVVDSSLINSALQSSVDSTWIVDTSANGSHWYYSSGVSYMGVQAFGFNTTDNADGQYYRATSQLWNVTSFSGSTLYVSVDVRLSKIGDTSTDYLNVYLVEFDSAGNKTQATSITGGLKTTSSWTNYRKKITVDSATKTMYIQYSMRGNGNGYVARPYVGNIELPEGGYTPGPIQSTSTILSLMKDNWSIGIADNIGNIVSGIAGNSAQMAIISDKVIIKSPNTQITGTAWIKTAMIANGAIGTAQIGDASITSAKILALDVNKLSGNISNFIQSNWNGDYGSVSISSWGMTVTTVGVNTEFNSAGMELTYSNELAGGIGVGGWDGMADNYQGLYFGLSGKGDFMSFGARDVGVETGLYSSKLAWMRTNWKAPTMNSGWTFMDDVTFENSLIPKGSSNQKMVLGTSTFNNNPYPYFGDSRYGAGFAYGSSQTYLISDNTFYNITPIIKAFDKLGSIKIPSEIRSDGTVAKWYNLSI